MLFTELRFFGFFAVCYAVHWALRSHGARKEWLLLCSIVFYGAWDWRFLTLIFVSTGIDYVVARRLEETNDDHRRKALLVVSLVTNLGLLAFFKYFGFFVDSAFALADALGVRTTPRTLEVVLPVGISFYTFQTLSYTIDVYRKHIPAERSLLNFAFFVMFFPQLVAGPIVRAADFLPQVQRACSFWSIRYRGAIGLILVGFFKKACVSDNLSVFADRYFSDPAAYDTASAWLGTLCYSAQIYCDFSGYSDIAIGTAALLGYNLVVNFDAPYFSASITEFWQRWHISLSTWLRDYLYIPLGGNRNGSAATYRNLLFTMILGGLWHGAAWRFVLWGAMHGIGLAVHRAIGSRVLLRKTLVGKALGMALTMYWVAGAWIFFRAEDLSKAFAALEGFVLLQADGKKHLPMKLAYVLVALVALHALWRLPAARGAWRRAPNWSLALGYGVFAALVASLVPTEARPFIYFQF